MAELISKQRHNNSIKETWMEDGKLYEKMHFNFDTQIKDAQELYNENMHVYSRGNETFVEQLRIPEELWWHLREAALATGRKTHKEISDYVINLLKGPEYSKFRVNKIQIGV